MCRKNGASIPCAAVAHPDSWSTPMAPACMAQLRPDRMGHVCGVHVCCPKPNTATTADRTRQSQKHSGGVHDRMAGNQRHARLGREWDIVVGLTLGVPWLSDGRCSGYGLFTATTANRTTQSQKHCGGVQTRTAGNR